jgi:hypothetical protein
MDQMAIVPAAPPSRLGNEAVPSGIPAGAAPSPSGSAGSRWAANLNNAVLSAVEAAALGPRMLRGNQASEKLYRDNRPSRDSRAPKRPCSARPGAAAVKHRSDAGQGACQGPRDGEAFDSDCDTECQAHRITAADGQQLTTVGTNAFVVEPGQIMGRL